MGAGIYVSIPFCKAKCSFCNFASGVFAAERMDGYVGRLLDEMRGARAYAKGLRVTVPGGVDSIYFGGGTPSLLEPEMVVRVFAGVRGSLRLRWGVRLRWSVLRGRCLRLRWTLF
ncbi:hypothetical protein [Granulicella tundricola]|uniref:hypothetical protein n=1 Tax=Granulicella tundricola TaxID=940615 RepID=UPI00031C23C2|nr:hypothetical protein [Granulicella tundricola]